MVLMIQSHRNSFKINSDERMIAYSGSVDTKVEGKTLRQDIEARHLGKAGQGKARNRHEVRGQRNRRQTEANKKAL